jgi:predicted RecA/RadA family phage recombinase
MNTFVKRGNRLTYSNSGSAITAGSVVVLTSGTSGMVGIAVTDIAATTGTGEVAVCGVHTLTMLTADTGSIGTTVYWDATNSRLTTTSTSNTLAGKLAAAKTNSQTTADVLLNGLPGEN